MEKWNLLAGLAHTKNYFWYSTQNVAVKNTSAFSDLPEYSGDVLQMQYDEIR